MDQAAEEKCHSEQRALFDSNDVRLLQQAVSMHPNLECACMVVKIAQRTVSFPLKSAWDFEPMFCHDEIPEQLRVRGFRLGHVKQFFPEPFYPVENERDLLGKLVAVLSYGDRVHYLEKCTGKSDVVDQPCKQSGSHVEE